MKKYAASVSLTVLSIASSGLLILGAELLQKPGLDAALTIKFEVSVSTKLTGGPRDGRLFVILNPRNSPEPRLSIGNPGIDAPPMIARDVRGFGPGKPAVLDRSAASFPVSDLSQIPPGEYYVQSVFDDNADLSSVNAPGNLYSKVKKINLQAGAYAIRLELTEQVPPEEIPPDTEYLRYIRIQSQLLSSFHGRPIYLRAGVILPAGYREQPDRRYPLRIHIGGYGSRYTEVASLMSGGSSFRQTWLDDGTPRMILLYLDGDGPFGDSYQVNSANNGPYGDAITQELIPYVERQYRAIGHSRGRFLDGGSTGGWVALALQIFYPDYFNGAWAFCPDSVDFRAFQLIDIYAHDNSYVNQYGFERPSKRDLNGEVEFTVRHECQMENVMGAGDSWTMSGGQWGAWNAAYGPRGEDGRPVPLWDAKTGEINKNAVQHWRKYDLRMILEENWKTLGPGLRGKIRIWTGEADNYFLNNSVHLLESFLSRTEPPYEGMIMYGPGKGHCWMGISEREILSQMAARAGN